MGKVQLLPWCQEAKNMDDIYVTLELKEGRNRSTLLEQNEDLVTLQTSQNMPATRILLSGKAGSGKSTLLAKLAYSWAQQNVDSPLAKFKLVFILSLREIQVGCSLIDAIFQQVFETNTKVSKSFLKNYIESHSEDICLFLDGFDEYSATKLTAPVGSLEEILAYKALRQCHTILSTRPHKDLRNHQSFYVTVKVLGFSPENIELYMTKFFEGEIEIVEGLKERLKESDILTSLSGIPVMLMLMCLLWKDEKKLHETQSQLYQDFVLFMWRKYWARNGEEVECDDESDKEKIKKPMLELSKVALSGICPDRNIKAEKIVFSESDFDPVIFQLGCDTGLLTRERMRSKLKKCSSVIFLHKSFQEFCAATYWASLLVTNYSQFNNTLKQLKTWQLFLNKFELVKFCCGLVNVKVVVLILQHAISLYTKGNDDLSKIRVGYDKPQSSRKHIIPILTLLYESQFFYKYGESNDTEKQHANHQSNDKPNDKTEYSQEIPQVESETVLNYQSSESCELKSSLTESFKLLFPDHGLELDISSKSKLSTSIFQNFINSYFGSSVLATIKSVSVFNLNASSLILMNDIFKHMSKVQEIRFVISSKLKLGKHDQYVHFTLRETTFNLFHMVKLLTNQEHLKSFNLTDIALNQENLPVGDTKQCDPDVSLSLRYDNTDEVKECRSIMDAELEVNIYLDAVNFVQHLHHCIKLRTLRLNFCALNNENIRKLTELFISQASNMQVLAFNTTKVGKNIEPLAKELQHCAKLHTLKLFECHLNEDHIKILSELFLSKAYNLQILDLSFNTVGMAVDFLANQLKHCTKLHTLILCKCQLKEDHIKMLSELYLSKASNLKVLDLSHNTIGDCVKPLAIEQQLQHWTKLNKLILQQCQLKEDHIKMLSEVFLSKASHLQVLDLSHNTVGMAVKHLVEQLQHCTRLTNLTLFRTNLTNQGVIELAHRFHYMPNLTWIDIGGNDITNTGFDAVFRHIHHLTNLETFRISDHVDNQCSDLVKDCLTAVEEDIPDHGKKWIQIEGNLEVEENNISQIQAIKRAASNHI